MAGIAEALVATGVGLFVALPAVVAYNLIQKRIGEIESGALSLTKLLTAYVHAADRAESTGQPIARVAQTTQDASSKAPAEEAAEDDALATLVGVAE